jgi:hypothetical protein
MTPVPPVASTVALPLFAPLHEIFVVESRLTFTVPGVVILKQTLLLQLEASVTVTQYVPGAKLFLKPVVFPPELHK